MRGERVMREINAIERLIILAAILKMIDHLQRRAERVIGGPCARGIFAMHIEHEATDRHRRITAVVDQLVPVLVTQLGHVASKRDKQIARMLTIQSALFADAAQTRRDILIGTNAHQRVVQPVQQRKLLIAAQGWVIRNIVGGANEIVKAHDRRAMTGHKNGRDGKILVAMGFAGTCVGDLDHAPVNALLRTREQDKPRRFVVGRPGISPIS